MIIREMSRARRWFFTISTSQTTTKDILSIAYKLKKCKTGKEIAFSEQQIACFSRAFSCIMYL